MLDNFVISNPDRYDLRPSANESEGSINFLIKLKALIASFKKDTPLFIKTFNLQNRRVFEHTIRKMGLTNVTFEGGR